MEQQQGAAGAAASSSSEDEQAAAAAQRMGAGVEWAAEQASLVAALSGVRVADVGEDVLVLALTTTRADGGAHSGDGRAVAPSECLAHAPLDLGGVNLMPSCVAESRRTHTSAVVFDRVFHWLSPTNPSRTDLTCPLPRAT